MRVPEGMEIEFNPGQVPGFADIPFDRVRCDKTAIILGADKIIVNIKLPVAEPVFQLPFPVLSQYVSQHLADWDFPDT